LGTDCTPADGWDIFITTTARKEEVCRGLDARRVAAILEQKGMLVTDNPRHRAKVIRMVGARSVHFTWSVIFLGSRMVARIDLPQKQSSRRLFT
jgi:hypothetical protein